MKTNITNEMNNHKIEPLEAMERYAFLFFIVAIAFSVSYGYVVGTMVIFGLAFGFKLYMFLQYKKADLLNEFWEKSSKAGLGAGLIILVLVMMSYFDINLF